MSCEPIHRLVTGVTMTGKTTYARLKLVEPAYSAGWQIVIFDPIGTGFDCGAVYDDIDDFLDVCDQLAERASLRQRHGQPIHPVLCVVDEADMVFGHSVFSESKRLVTRYRHYGFSVVMCTQRPNLIHPSIRTMCGETVGFRLAKSDAKMMADDMAAPGLIECSDLAAGEFIRAHWVNKKRLTTRGKVF